jgi:hypothetical protein
MTASNSRGRAPARGIRNHNPGNLRRSSDPWQGLAPEQTDREFFQFTSPKWGIRALARTLIVYQDRGGLKTIDQMISRWAPPNENNTGAYVAGARAQDVVPQLAALLVGPRVGALIDRDHELRRLLQEAQQLGFGSFHRTPPSLIPETQTFDP